MQILVRRRPERGDLADVELSIFNDDRFIYLEGITVRQPRPGWTTLEIPPLEAWEKPMRWLTPEQRERIETAEFFQLVQTHVTKKYLALRKSAVAGEVPASAGQTPEPPPAGQRPAKDQPRGRPARSGLGWQAGSSPKSHSPNGSRYPSAPGTGPS